MAVCTPAALLSSASCFACLSEKQLAAINAYLLCQILNGGGGGGGAANNFVSYTSGTPPAPADPTKPGWAYDPTGNLQSRGWDVSLQQWSP